jgi:hypothetical protein
LYTISEANVDIMGRPQQSGGKRSKNQYKCNACNQSVRGCDFPRHYRENTNWEVVKKLKQCIGNEALERVRESSDEHSIYIFENKYTRDKLPTWHTHPTYQENKVVEDDSEDDPHEDEGECPLEECVILPKKQATVIDMFLKQKKRQVQQLSSGRSKSRSSHRTKSRSSDRARNMSLDKSRISDRARNRRSDRARSRSSNRARSRSSDRARNRRSDRTRNRSRSSDWARSRSSHRARNRSSYRARSRISHRNSSTGLQRRIELGRVYLERSKSETRERSKSVERSKNPSVERSKSPSVERSKSPSVERSQSPSVERSKSLSVERSKSPSVERSKKVQGMSMTQTDLNELAELVAQKITRIQYEEKKRKERNYRSYGRRERTFSPVGVVASSVWEMTSPHNLLRIGRMDLDSWEKSPEQV